MGRRQPESQSSQRRIAAKERWTEALVMRRRGMTFERIGEVMGCGKQSAHRMITAAMKELRETCHEEAAVVRELELQRLDAMFETAYQQATGADDAHYLDAIDRVLKIMDRRAKLLGLDAPAKIAPTDPTGGKSYEYLTDAERASRVVALLERARARRDGDADPAGDTEVP